MAGWKDTFANGFWKENPISVQVLGICSVLAVTTTVVNSIVMAASLVFVVSTGNFFVSLLRKWIPANIRMTATVATR